MQDEKKLDRRREVRAEQPSVLCCVKERLKPITLFGREVRGDLDIRLPTFRHFPYQNAQEAWMFNQVVKRHLHKRFEEGSHPLCLRDERFIREPGRKHARQERIHFPVSALEHLGIEAKLIPKVAKEQLFVVARDVRDRIDARAIETMFRKHDFRRGEYRLASRLSSPFGVNR